MVHCVQNWKPFVIHDLQVLSSSLDGRPFGQNSHWLKRGEGLLCPFRGGGARSPSNTIWPGPRSTSVPSGILIHPAVWSQQTWADGLCPFGGGELGPHLTQHRLGWGLPPYQVASWSIQPSGHNKYGPKSGGCAPFFGRGSWVPT